MAVPRVIVPQEDQLLVQLLASHDPSLSTEGRGEVYTAASPTRG